MTEPSMLHQYLEASARRVPDRTAVRFRGAELTYRQLYGEAAALAATLASRGIGGGDRVAFWLPKGFEAITCIHGILMAGAAYVPVDPASPPARAAYILGNCQVSALVTTAEHRDLLDDDVLSALSLVVVTDGGGAPAVHDAAAGWIAWSAAVTPPAAPVASSPPMDPDRLAYVLYTSGSTGTPKGVKLSHRNADVLVQWACRRFGIDERDRVSSHAPLHFDLSIIDVFAAALSGATLVLVPDNQRVFGAAMLRLIVSERITVWYSVPGALIAMLDATNSDLLDEATLRVVLYAGEVFPVPRLRELVGRLPAAEIHNLYGPTETNVCTAHRVRPEDVAEGVAAVPIGKLCDFATGHLLTSADEQVDLSAGSRGELVVGGSSVMLGYWDGSAPANEGARPNGGRVHRTGDLVHVDADGNLVFEGRRDDMVKIRGYRVEPAEVEAAILACADVSEACVVAVAGDDGVAHLEAYVVAARGGVDLQALNRVCLERLPRYMLPAHVEVVAELPRGSTGKIDRRALTLRSQARVAVASEAI